MPSPQVSCSGRSLRPRHASSAPPPPLLRSAFLNFPQAPGLSFTPLFYFCKGKQQSPWSRPCLQLITVRGSLVSTSQCAASTPAAERISQHCALSGICLHTHSTLSAHSLHAVCTITTHCLHTHCTLCTLSPLYLHTANTLHTNYTRHTVCTLTAL